MKRCLRDGGAVGGLGGVVVCLAGLQAGQARLPSRSLLGRTPGEGVGFEASWQQAGGGLLNWGQRSVDGVAGADGAGGTGREKGGRMLSGG